MLYQRQMQKYIHLIGGGGEWFFSHQDDQNTLFWNILMKICKNFFIFLNYHQQELVTKPSATYSPIRTNQVSIGKPTRK